MKILSLFDGISCGMIAAERAGIKVDRYVAYEIEDTAIRISKKNYPEIEQRGNVYDADFSQYKNFDLLIGGSPCTYWSIAKKNREVTSSGIGFDLFMQYVRAKKESGCRYFLYENNNSISQDIKDEISKALGVRPIMINSGLVSAQSRKRCYWTNIPGVSQPDDRGISLQSILTEGWTDREKSLCLCRRYAGFTGSQSYLCRRYFGKSMGQAKFASEDAMVRAKKMWSEDPHYASEEQLIMPLNITEVERLQTLPDGYTECEGVSNSMRIEAIGNGWTVDVIAHIMKGLPDNIINDELW